MNNLISPYDLGTSLKNYTDAQQQQNNSKGTGNEQ